MANYTYIGDKLAKSGKLVGKPCTAVRRDNGKCIRGKNGNMLVEFDGTRVVVPAKHLRKTEGAQVSAQVPEIMPARVFAQAPEVYAIAQASGRIVEALAGMYREILAGMVGKSANTKNTYYRNAARFIEYIQDNGIHAGTFGQYREALALATGGVSIQTKNAYLAAARALLREACRYGVLPMDITSGVPSFKAARGHVKDGLTAAEVRKVFEYIQTNKTGVSRARLVAMFYLFAAEGLRQFEVQNLEVADVDLKNCCIRFRGKGRDAKERFYITPQTAEALGAYIEAAGITGGYVFASDTKPGDPISLRAIRKHFTCPKYGIFARCGIAGKSTHGFRHYNITTTLKATGGDLVTTRRRSRHTGFNMLEVYDDERLARADVEALAVNFVF